MIQVFENCQELAQYRDTLHVIDTRRELSRYQHASLLVYDRANGRVLVSQQYWWNPLMEVLCATLECDVKTWEHIPMTQPFAALADFERVEWRPMPNAEQRVGILTVGGAEEISDLLPSLKVLNLYKNIDDLSSHYFWVHRSLLPELLRKRSTRGLKFAATLLPS